MAIDFRCPQCDKLLRTPDETAGKQAKCPQCGALVPIPSGPSSVLPAEATPAANPYQAPAAYDPRMSAAPGAAPASGRFEIGDVLTRSWEIYKNQLGLCILVVIACFVINYIAQFAANLAVLPVQMAVNEPVVVGITQAVASIVLSVFQTWIGLGQLIYLLKIARGQTPVFTDIFSGGRYLLPAIGATLLVMLMMAVILMFFAAPVAGVYFATEDEDMTLIAGIVAGALFVIPAMFLGIIFSQFQLLIVDRNAGPIQALTWSKDITSGNRFSLLGLYIILGFVNLLGLLACCVGMIFTMPYVFVAVCVCYLVMTGQPTAEQLMPRPAAAPAYQPPINPPPDSPPPMQV